MKIAIVPARGGSKRIPRKNIKPFCGKPMIAWSIEAAQQSHCFDRIIVSTDDTEIAEVAGRYGAEAPFVRPAELADDHTGTSAVVRHAIEWLRQNGDEPTEVCCIYATAPFLQASDLSSGLAMLLSAECDFVFSLTRYAFPIQRAVRITEEQRIEMFQPEHLMTRSQDLVEAYHDAGQFYWGKVDAWVAGKSSFSGNSVPLVLPRYRVQDIDTAEDWITAEYLFRAINSATDIGR